MVLFSLVHPLAFGRILVALGAGLSLAACAAVESPRRASESSPALRCVNDPGHGQSVDPRRPLFFLFCIQSP